MYSSNIHGLSNTSFLLHFFLSSPTDPQKAPLLPGSVVSTVARFNFNVLTIPLIFSTIASSVTIDSLGDYWFVLIGAFGVLAISFFTSTVLSFFLPISNRADFCALRIASTFGNIVALPILIFPSLCEYPVVYQAFGTRATNVDGNNGQEGVEMIVDKADQYAQCVANSTTMIFCYFFGWSLMFWSFGHGALLNAAEAKEKQQQSTNTEHNDNIKKSASTGDLTAANTDHDASLELASGKNPSSKTVDTNTPNQDENKLTVFGQIKHALRQTFASPPFIAMLLAFVVGCIAPIRDLFFSQGGALRFIGAAMETLGSASSPMSTMIVAASLATRQDEEVEREQEKADKDDDEYPNDKVSKVDSDHHQSAGSSVDEETPSRSQLALDMDDPEGSTNLSPKPISMEEESPVMSDPNFGPMQLRRRSSVHRFASMIQQKSVKMVRKARRTPPEQRRLFTWFTLSKLILSPALVILAIVGLDCSGILIRAGVPDLAKLVLIVNAAVPGALIVVVLLKSNPKLHETASVVARVYLPTYILSIVTIAAWTAVGLIVSIPDEDGNSFCHR